MPTEYHSIGLKQTLELVKSVHPTLSHDTKNVQTTHQSLLALLFYILEYTYSNLGLRTKSVSHILYGFLPTFHENAQILPSSRPCPLPHYFKSINCNHLTTWLHTTYTAGNASLNNPASDEELNKMQSFTLYHMLQIHNSFSLLP